MDVYKINIKFYLKEGQEIENETWFRTFNTWIPDTKDEVLIDVADYSHVQDGPITLLIGHEANYSIDNGDGRLGLLYNRKQPLNGNLEERFREIFLRTLKACLRLQQDPSLEGKVNFSGDEFWLQMNDRLLTPNTEETFTVLEPTLKELVNALYAGSDFSLQRNPDPKQLFYLKVKAEGDWEIPALLKNIETDT